MKNRIGFVSNSSSSSFILFKDILSDKQLDMVMNYDKWITFLKEIDNVTFNDKFDYYHSDPWRIYENEDYIFGETSMDNFDISEYFDYIKIDQKYLKWDDGYTDIPYQRQLNFIQQMKQEYRKNKLIKINKKYKL